MHSIIVVVLIVENLDYQEWDKQLEQDIIKGKLDDIASEALAEFEAGDYQEM